MRHTRLLAALLCLALGAAAVYVSYDSVRSADPGGTAPRVETLGELLDPQNDVSIREMEPALQDLYVGDVMQHPAFLDTEAFFLAKDLVWDWGSTEALEVHIDGSMITVFSVETFPCNGTYGVYVFARDEQGGHLIWRMVTNIGQKSVEGGDPTISDIPVYVWSNGMPVYYVYVWQWFGGIWHPYHYWWHNSHNHPNWYYSYYNYWWWRYCWYDYYWAPWYNWFYTWYYWRFFYYWSTWFPY
jgi:hypothetical protein